MNKTFNCWEPLPSEAENYLTSCLNEKNFSDNAKELFAKRYYVPYFDTSTNEMNKEYCLNQLIKRVGRIIASGLIKEFNRQLNWFKMKSSEYDATCLKEKFLALMRIVEFNIRKDISLKRFLFNSPALFSSGVGLVEKEMSSRIIYDVKVEDMTFSNYEYLFKNKSPYQQLCACFVIDVDDNLDSIFDSVKEAAIISKFCGGVGCNWSSLREKNAPIKDGSIGNSSGPVSFMELWNTMGKVVVQGGKRRSAIMSMMDIDHPDIKDFIHAKEHDGSLQYFNISTRLDDEFLNAVKYEKPYYLKSRLSKDVNLADGIKREMKLTQIDANELFDEICTCAHKNGEPGIIFGDKINKDNLLKHLPDWQIKATNPCFASKTLILTNNGYQEIGKLTGQEIIIINENGEESISNIFESGIKETIELKIRIGTRDHLQMKTIRCTPDHIFKLSDGSSCMAKDLKNKRIKPFIKPQWDFDLDWVKLGFIQGDGITNSDPEKAFKYVCIGKNDLDIFHLFNVPIQDDYHVNISSFISEFESKYQLQSITQILDPSKIHLRELPVDRFNWSKKQISSFLRGLFSANGCIIHSKYNRIALKSTNYNLVVTIQQILKDNFQIESYITTNKKKNVLFKNGLYECKESYDLNIGQFHSILSFYENIGFVHQYKMDALARTILDKSPLVSSIKFDYKKVPVYDFTEPKTHWGVIDGLIAHNCGEQPLPTYTSCVLGSINLEAFINKNENNFSDYEFIRQIHRSILYLDCVVDANSYPLKKIEERTQDIRPLGLGFMGLANAAIKLKMGYGSHNFNQFCKYIGKLMAKHSMYASIDLCEVMEFNPFRFAKEAISHYTSELTYDDLPPSIKMIFDEQENKDECRNKYLQLFLEGKLRNSRRLTIAPTGCSVKESYVVNNNGILRFDEIGVIDSKEQWNDLDNCHVIQENGIATATKFYINGHAQTKKITTFSNLELESTLNHKYRILADNGEYIWKEVSELKVGDKLVYKIGGYSKDSDPTLIFEEKDYHGNCRGIRIPSTLTPEFAKFIGIFTGNGSKHKQGLRISFNKNHNDKIQLTVDLIKSLFNISPVVLEDKRINTKDIYINSVILQDILLQLNLLKKSSREACIPKLIRQSSNLSILSFIEGLYMTDGSHNGNNKYIDTSSYQLAQELLIVLRAIGINGKIVIDKKRTGAKSKNYMYRIYFNTYGSENSEIKDRYISKIKKRDHESLKHISKDLYAEAIMEIIDSENDTYDIEVPKNNTYVLNSYISHNSISMLFDTSSGIEPNFAYQYDRRISKGHNVWEIVQYTHPLYMTKEEYENQKTSKDDNYEEVYIKANDLSIEKHMQPLKILSKYIDSAISKTINLPSEATVEDVKNIYLDAFDSSIKGVTVYRDGSRGSQPIVDTTKKEEKKENIGTLVKDNEHIYTGKVRERSQFMRSITTKMAVEPYGSIYLTATLDENGNIFEIFSSIGKSGQMLKTMMEALSRIISIALRSGTNIQDVIGTLKFMSGTDRWIYDTFDKKEIEVNSIPDMLARMLEDIQKHFTGTGEKLETIESKHQEELTIHGDICPECGKELSHYDGCKICWSCQYSACK